MKLSTDRILTTHVGSLPRPQALVDLLVKKDAEQAYDHAEFDRQATKAVGEIVAHQVAIGTRFLLIDRQTVAEIDAPDEYYQD